MPDSDNIDAPVDAPVDPALAEPTFTASHVHRLNQEAAGWRLKLRQAEAELVTLKASAAELATLKAEARELKLNQAVTETANRLGADPRLTKAILSAEGHLAGLNPDLPDFAAAITGLVQTVMESAPQIRRQPAGPMRSGSDLGTNNRGPNVQPREAITRADLTAMNPEEIASRYAKGDLDAVLGRTQ
jgi:hypothetical protein